MPGLGIAAGAFEGDNARKEQAQRDQQLALQAQAQALQAQQAKMADDRAREAMALDEENRKAERAFNQQRMVEQARQVDAGRGVDQIKQKEQVRQFDAGLKMQTQEQQHRELYDQFGQQEAIIQSDWADILNSQKFEEADMQYQKLLKLRDEEEKQRQQRDQVAKSAVGQMIRAAYEGGGVPGKNFLSASQMEYFRKSDPRFQGLQSVTWGDDGKGNKVLQMTHQGQDGQPVSEVITPEQQFLALSSIYGEKMANGIFGRTDKAAYNEYLVDRGGSIASKDSRSMSKIDELNYAALAKQNAESQYEDPKVIKAMQDIEKRYGISQPAPAKLSQEEEIIKGRSIRGATMPKSASQQQPQQGQRLPTSREAGRFNVINDAQEIKDIVLNYIPKDQQEAVVAEITKIDPTGTNPETIKMLRKRFVDPKEEAKMLSNSAFNRFHRM